MGSATPCRTVSLAARFAATERSRAPWSRRNAASEPASETAATAVTTSSTMPSWKSRSCRVRVSCQRMGPLLVATLTRCCAERYSRPRSPRCWPSRGAARRRPGGLRLMVPNAPGSGYDITARTVATALDASGVARNVDVFHLPGAGGAVGLRRLVYERGNGALMMLMGLGMVGAQRAAPASATLADVTPVARLIEEPEAFVVTRDSPLAAMADLVRGLAGGAGEARRRWRLDARRPRPPGADAGRAGAGRTAAGRALRPVRRRWRAARGGARRRRGGRRLQPRRVRPADRRRAAARPRGHRGGPRPRAGRADAARGRHRRGLPQLARPRRAARADRRGATSGCAGSSPACTTRGPGRRR